MNEGERHLFAILAAAIFAVGIVGLIHIAKDKPHPAPSPSPSVSASHWKNLKSKPTPSPSSKR